MTTTGGGEVKSQVKKLDSADVSVRTGKLRPVKRIKAKKQRRTTF